MNNAGIQRRATLENFADARRTESRRRWAPRQIDRFIALVGHPVAQVRSPEPINALPEKRGANAVLIPVDVAPEGLSALVAGFPRTSNCVGLSVTVQAVASRCDTLSPRAQATGGANIVRREADGSLVGEMTDGLALVDALKRVGFDVAKTRCALIGAGSAIGCAPRKRALIPSRSSNSTQRGAMRSQGRSA